MFSGIVTTVAEVSSIERTSNSMCLGIRLSPKPSSGESIAVNGVCLTALETSTPEVTFFDVSHETLDKTNLKSLQKGDLVNIETALKLNDLLSGHLVQGHIDGTGQVIEVIDQILKVRLPQPLSKYVVLKGSVALNGISLTINEINKDIISLTIIPHTWEHTNLKHIKSGDDLNIEVDVLAKYVERLLKPI